MREPDIKKLILARQGISAGAQGFYSKPMIFEFTKKRELFVRWNDRHTCIDCSQFNNAQVAEILDNLGYR